MPAGRAPLRRRRPGGAPPAEAGTRECDVGPRTAGEVYGDRGAGPNRGQGGTVHRARSSPVDQIYRDRRRVPGRIRAMFWSGLSVLLLTGWLGAIPPAAQWPVDPPVILQAFAAPATDYGPGHRGLDLAVRPGDEIRAPLPGVIGFVGSVAGTPIVAIDHPDGLRTTYEPAQTRLPVGTEVAEGQVVAYVGVGAGHCGSVPPCLHWGLKRADVYFDPASLVTAVAPVLLPVDEPPASTDVDTTSADPPRSVQRSPSTLVSGMGAALAGGAVLLVLSRRRLRRAWRATAAPPWYASDRSGSR
jgi:hypothetical protein